MARVTTQIPPGTMGLICGIHVVAAEAARDALGIDTADITEDVEVSVEGTALLVAITTATGTTEVLVEPDGSMTRASSTRVDDAVSDVIATTAVARSATGAASRR